MLHFAFKALRPTFDLHPFSVHGHPAADGKTVHLWSCDHAGWRTMDATATRTSESGRMTADLRLVGHGLNPDDS